MTLSDDKTACTCVGDHKKPNPFGLCSYCFVEHCASCDFDPMFCRMCVDENANTETGVCSCPDGQMMDASGICGTCDVEHCEACADGDTTTCEICEHPYMPDGNGGCECPQSRRVDQSGECVLCSENCLDCSTEEGTGSEICHECSSTTTLNIDDGTCSCPQGQRKNLAGTCIPCS